MCGTGYPGICFAKYFLYSRDLRFEDVDPEYFRFMGFILSERRPDEMGMINDH